jgi:uncharacterized protein (TIGR03435 family)
MMAVLFATFGLQGGRKMNLKIAGANIALLLAGTAFGQAPEPQFEVADIRQNKSGETAVNGGVIAGGQVSVRNAPLKMLLGFAYYPKRQKFRDKFIVGAPAWTDSDRFDIVAKAPPGTPARQCLFSNYCYPDETLPVMLKGLLAQRFKVTAHEEQRRTPVYALMAAKGGPKLKPSSAAGDLLCRRIAGETGDPAAKKLSADQAGFVCANMTMARLGVFCRTWQELTWIGLWWIRRA